MFCMYSNSIAIYCQYSFQKKKIIEMHFKLDDIILIQNDTAVITKIFKNWMYYLKSASKQQTLTNQNDLISLITTPTVTAPTDLARQFKNSDIKSKKINKYFKWHVQMRHAESDHLLKTIQTINNINKNIEINKNKCVIYIFNKMMKIMNKLLFLWITKLSKWIFFDFWKKYKITGIKNKKHFLFFMNNYLKMFLIYIWNRNKTKQ